MNLVSMSKVLKCAGNDDQITIRADDEGDTVKFCFESTEGDRVSDFELKLMDIDSENLGIPDTEYKCTVTMPSAEFQRIVRDLSVLGDTCIIKCSKEGVSFKVRAGLGSGAPLARARSLSGAGRVRRRRRRRQRARALPSPRACGARPPPLRPRAIARSRAHLRTLARSHARTHALA